MPSPTSSAAPFWDLETRLSVALSTLAGFIGAAAYAHSAGYFVTFMTGNTERAIVANFLGEYTLAAGAAGLIVCFVVGVIVASVCRRHWWRNHPHGATVLATAALTLAAIADRLPSDQEQKLGLAPILFVAFGMGALNASFVKNGEVSIPVTYVTGTLVKLAQGIENHIAGGTAREWLGYAVQYFSFALGALIGGLISLLVDGHDMLAVAVIGSAVVAVYTWIADPPWVVKYRTPDTAPGEGRTQKR